MKKSQFYLITTLFCMSIQLSPLSASLEKASLFEARGGIPNVAAKLERGEAVNVVFIGGSVTRGGGDAGYVSVTEQWLKEQYPSANIQVINAGVSGTDSNFGAKRYDRDVLVHNPDLVLIEFAVNDGNRDHSAHMERMVHKTWMKNPSTDIIIFYNLSKEHLNHYKNGNLPPAASAHERIAQHYGIPTVGLAYDVAGKFNRGEIEWSQFANDAVHPNASGYKLFNAVFQEVLPKLLKTGAATAQSRLKTPLTPNLQVYPPALQAKPLIVEPFVNAAGETATRSYALPMPSIHWVENSDYQEDSGKTLWRLHWMDKKKSAAMNEHIGLIKKDWAGNLMEWFEEDKSFTGKEGNPIFDLNKNQTMLGFSGFEVAVLIFIAPETGTYAFNVGADSLHTWKNEETDFALNVGYFAWGEEQGKPLLHYRSKRKDVTPFTLNETLEMVAGEELAFIVGTDSPGYIRGGWVNFKVHVGYYGKK